MLLLISGKGNAGFEVSHFEKLASSEEKHFWFRIRNKLILWALDKYFKNTNKFLEIGCGTGFVLSGIEKEFPSLDLYGSEIHQEGLRFASKRVSRAKLFQIDATSIPFKEEFDVIGSFDVLEHIRQDEKVLCEINKALKPGGGIILTVPQHPFLWSRYDEEGHHVRRYTALELKTKVEYAGFKVIYMTSFVFLLLPLVIVSRLMPRFKKEQYDVLSELKIGKSMNFFFEKILFIEYCMIKLGFKSPIGSSLLLIAKKI